MQSEINPDRTESVDAFVRRWRKANRMTQQELAELAGVGLRFLRELERGKPTVQVASVNAVLNVFGKQLGVVDRPRGSDREDNLDAGIALSGRDRRARQALERDRMRLLWRS